MKKYTKEEVFDLIRNKKYKKLIPLLVNDFQGVFSTQEMKYFIVDEDSGFFKAVITSIGKYLDEIYDYEENFNIESLRFMSICDSLEGPRIQSLCLSVMTDKSINNYSPLIEQGFLLKFTLDELLEILESFDKNRLLAFLQSVNNAIRYFSEIDGYQDDETFRLLNLLGKNLPESLKTTMIQMITSSKPQPVYLGKMLIYRSWDLPLNLDKIGWFKELNLEQLQMLIYHLKSNYRDKIMDSSERRSFRFLIKALNTQQKENHEFPFEDLPLSKAQIREFLYRLAGEEGCQYTKLEWHCGGKEFIYAKKILNSMKVPTNIQELFLDLCKTLGGNCDCEILMNAASKLLKEETPW